MKHVMLVQKYIINNIYTLVLYIACQFHSIPYTTRTSFCLRKEPITLESLIFRSSIFGHLDDDFANMSLRGEIRVSLDGVLEGENFVDDRVDLICSEQAVHVFESTERKKKRVRGVREYILIEGYLLSDRSDLDSPKDDRSSDSSKSDVELFLIL